MQIIIEIPDEQIKKSLKESEYVLEDEGIKGFVNIAMLYTNGRLEFVDIERREDFYSCNFTPLPKGHGRIIDESKINKVYTYTDKAIANNIKAISTIITGTDAPTIIEKESE